MPAPTVHESRSGGGPPKSGDGVLHLTVMAPNLFETHPLPAGGSISIGRDDGADVRITDELASRLHARLHVDSGGTLAVEDLDSSNGTFVRGERIETGQRVPLQPGEAVTIGFTHLMVQRRRPAPPRAPVSRPRCVRGAAGRCLRPGRGKRRDARDDPRSRSTTKSRPARRRGHRGSAAAGRSPGPVRARRLRDLAARHRPGTRADDRRRCGQAGARGGLRPTRLSWPIPPTGGPRRR